MSGEGDEKLRAAYLEGHRKGRGYSHQRFDVDELQAERDWKASEANRANENQPDARSGEQEEL